MIHYGQDRTRYDKMNHQIKPYIMDKMHNGTGAKQTGNDLDTWGPSGVAESLWPIIRSSHLKSQWVLLCGTHWWVDHWGLQLNWCMN